MLEASRNARLVVSPEVLAADSAVKHSGILNGSMGCGLPASLRSAATLQELVASHERNNTLQAPTAPITGVVLSKQPASPESVNAGQAVHAAAVAAAAAGLPVATAVGDPTPQTAQGVNSTNGSGPDGAGLPAAATADPAHSSPSPAGLDAGPALVPPTLELAAAPALAPTPSPAAAAQPEVELLEPLPPPDESEDKEVHTEYAVYLQRWHAGTTLRQRWHRLRASGVLEELKEEWEDWQHDLLLDTIQQQLGNPGSCSAPMRQRRGRADLEGLSTAAAGCAGAGPAPADQEPRRVRTRRAPASFQDFHLETPAAGSPDRTDPQPAQPDYRRRGTPMQQQLQEHPLQQQQQQQDSRGLPRWSAAPGGVLNGSSSLTAERQEQLHAVPQPQPSHMARQQYQQQQQHAPPPSDIPVSGEFIRKATETVMMLVRSGRAQQGMEGAAELLARPGALESFLVAVAKKTNENPAAIVHRMVAKLAGETVQH